MFPCVAVSRVVFIPWGRACRFPRCRDSQRGKHCSPCSLRRLSQRCFATSGPLVPTCFLRHRPLYGSASFHHSLLRVLGHKLVHVTSSLEAVGNIQRLLDVPSSFGTVAVPCNFLNDDSAAAARCTLPQSVPVDDDVWFLSCVVLRRHTPVSSSFAVFIQHGSAGQWFEYTGVDEASRAHCLCVLHSWLNCSGFSECVT
jgi:hypothetical protein